MIRGILRDVRNIYNSWRLCNLIYNNRESHTKCKKSSTCDVQGIVTPELTLFDKSESKKHDVNKYFFWITYAEQKDYVESFTCKSDKQAYLKLTVEGTDLTDKIGKMPTGLIIEVLKQHKVFFSVAGGLLYLWTKGITLNVILENIADKL